MNPDFSFENVDILTYEWTLRYLFKWVQSEHTPNVPLDTALVQDMLVIKHRRVHREFETGFENGLFEDVALPPLNLEDAECHYQVIRYNIGNLNCAVCSPVPLSYRTYDTQTDQKATPHDHAAGVAARNGESIETLDSDHDIPSFLWFSRISYPISGIRTGDVIERAEGVNMSNYVKKWDENEVHQGHLRILATVLSELRSLTHRSKTKACQVAPCLLQDRKALHVCEALYISPLGEGTAIVYTHENYPTVGDIRVQDETELEEALMSRVIAMER
ncbi:geranylgeranyl pyrophosphate synthetase [Fusarium austroafricanum]|uniref:Geranylgeranyl pyrophosphate synthetase n=1 Tax=Fusarium austroafricanum TaxID=2364996 RepID=A0A8H4JXP0_9HYPO|nr:geranylgeranyl pyrophosphate synthetase [Fusarium austroafricanum]